MKELMRFFQILQNKTTIEEQPANNEVIKPELNVNPRRFPIGTFFMLATVILVKTKQWVHIFQLETIFLHWLE